MKHPVVTFPVTAGKTPVTEITAVTLKFQLFCVLHVRAAEIMSLVSDLFVSLEV